MKRLADHGRSAALRLPANLRRRRRGTGALRSRATLVAFLLSLYSGLVRGAAPSIQAGFEALPGQRLRLMGDSIVKGYGFGNYTNPSPLRTIYGIANILLKDNLPHPPPV